MSDLISREAVIKDIKDLLTSPFAHSKYGAVTEIEAYIIRIEMAETIIDLCVKEADTAYDVEKVIEQLKEECISIMDKRFPEDKCNMYSKGAQGMFLKAEKIVKGGGEDE